MSIGDVIKSVWPKRLPSPYKKEKGDEIEDILDADLGKDVPLEVSTVPAEAKEGTNGDNVDAFFTKMAVAEPKADIDVSQLLTPPPAVENNAEPPAGNKPQETKAAQDAKQQKDNLISSLFDNTEEMEKNPTADLVVDLPDITIPELLADVAEVRGMLEECQKTINGDDTP